MSANVEFIRALLKALNLPPAAQRVVIEADIRQPLKVYYKGLLKDGEAAAKVVGLVETMAVADVMVTDDCEVVVVPLEKAG